MWVCGLDWAGPGQRQVADACECGNEPSGSVKCGEFLDQLQTSQFLKKDSAPWSKSVTKLDYTKCRECAQPFLYVAHLCHRYLRTHDEAHRRLWFLWSPDGTNTKAVGRCGCIGGCAFFGSNQNGAKFFKPSRQDIQDGINMATFR